MHGTGLFLYKKRNLCGEQIDVIPRKTCQHQNAAHLAQAVPLDEGKDIQQHRRAERDASVDEVRLRKGERVKEGRNARNDENIEDIAADDIAHGDIRFALDRRDDGGNEFGQRRAHRNDGEPDDAFAHARIFRDIGGGVYEEGAPAHDHRQADHDEQDKKPQFLLHLPVPAAERGLFFLFRLRFFGRGRKFRERLQTLLLPPRVCEENGHISRKNNEQNESVPPLQGGTPRAQPDEQNARGQQYGKIQFQRNFLHGKGVKEGRNAQNEQNIGDIAPDHIADGNIGGMFDRGGYGYGEFGRARAERDHGKPDDQ